MDSRRSHARVASSRRQRPRPTTLRTSPLFLLPILALAATADVPPVRTLGTIRLQPCTLATTGSPATVTAYCGTLAVPENRAAAASRSIDLAIALVPSRAKRPQPDPVLLLAGGPGQSALETFPTVAGAFGDVLRERNVVLVDQRGTGRSNPLNCPAPGGDAGRAADLEDPAVARRVAAQCRDTLDADLRYYTTSDAVLDLEAVRLAIGAPQLNLVAISYGTRVALEYLRRRPAATRSVVLDGVVPPELALGAEHARNLEDALDAQFARCERDAACSRQYGSPRALLDRLLAELRVEPRPVRYRDPLTDEIREEALTPATVAGVVRMYAYAPLLAALLPRSLAEAAAGRPEVLMAQARMIDSLIGEQIAQGMQLSVVCAEDADRLHIAPGDADTLLGTAFVASLQAQCEVWPKGRRPADFNTPVRSDRPVLLLSGELDPVTPPRYADAVARHLPNGRHLVGRGQGHNVMVAGCAPRLLGRFIASANAAALDASCLQGLAPPPPVLGAYGWSP
jgi:pimeloyl-ACP methyl ester carboxylesterase